MNRFLKTEGNYDRDGKVAALRVNFVTQWFPPEPGTVIASSIVDGLAARGHKVEVLTGFPNYPSGKLHPDYPLQRYRRENPSERVTIHRAPLYPSHDATAIRRSANYSSFALSAAWIARSRLSKPDVWLSYSSPATAALPALISPRRLRAPSYLIMQDLWPDSVIQSGMTGSTLAGGAERLLNAYCNWTYRRSAGIGIISPRMRRLLTDRGVDTNIIHLTPNWVDDDHLYPNLQASEELRRSLSLPAGRLFMYAGNLGELQGLIPLIEAFGRCPEYNLALVGDGIAKSSIQDLVARMGFRNIHFFPSKSTDCIGKYIAASDVQIVSLKDSLLLRATMPSKVQTSMAACRPILVHAAGDAAEIVTDAGAGLSAPPGDLQTLVGKIRGLGTLPAVELRAMGEKGRKFYERNYSAAAGLDRLELMLTGGLVSRPRAP